jgi:hypothetical protein
MKKIYLACLTIFTIHSGIQAQLTLTKSANEPVSGDIWITKKFDSTTVVPKNTGANQTWNFSTFSTTSQTSSVTYTNAAGTVGYSSFPGSTLAEIKGGAEIGYFKSTASTWEFMGFYDNSGPVTLNLSNTAIMNAWPTSYGNTTNDAVSGVMTAGSMTVNWSGFITTNASGYGTVVLPGGNTFTNCLMVVTSISLTIGTTDSYVEKRYSFYHSSEKFPIAEFWYETSTSGSSSTTSFGLDASVSLLTGINEAIQSEDFILIYPNPAKNWINIKTGNDKPALVEIFDVTGKTVLKQTVTQGLNVSELNPGLYVISTSSGTEKVTQRLIIQ